MEGWKEVNSWKSIPGSQFLEPTALKQYIQKPRPETTVRPGPESWKKVLSMILWRFTVAVGWHAVALQVVLSFVGHVLLNMLFFLLTLPLSTFPLHSPAPAISHLSVCLSLLFWLSHCVFVCLCDICHTARPCVIHVVSQSGHVSFTQKNYMFLMRCMSETLVQIVIKF